MAEKALELSALALACRFMGVDFEPIRNDVAPIRNAAENSAEPVPGAPVQTTLEFLKESADEHTRFYTAADRDGSLVAAFYSDGRLRIADEEYRFAGIVQNGHAHLLQIGGQAWSEVFVLVTPEGNLQLDMRDGPFDGRVFNCGAMA